MKTLYWGCLLILSQLFFTTSALAKDPIYTSLFSNKAVGGYDVIAYFEQAKPVKGNSKYKLSYQGADWLFSSEENRDKFQADPERYAPQYGGYCAWAVADQNDLAPGDPEYWTIVDGRLYLNYSRSVQADWEKDIPGFIAQADQNWPSLANK